MREREVVKEKEVKPAKSAKAVDNLLAVARYHGLKLLVAFIPCAYAQGFILSPVITG